MKDRPFGVLGAIDLEIRSVVAAMTGVEEETHGGRTFFIGHLRGQPLVLAASGVGKVAASCATTVLLVKYRVQGVLFVGVAGAISSELAVGDVLVAARLVQHDMNAQPFLKRHQLPGLKMDFLPSRDDLSRRLLQAAQKTTQKKRERVFFADIGSGDEFFSSQAQLRDLQARLPSVAAVDMESASMAQVCMEFQIPFAALRIVSDCVGCKRPPHFKTFLSQSASPMIAEILQCFFHRT